MELRNSDTSSFIFSNPSYNFSYRISFKQTVPAILTDIIITWSLKLGIVSLNRSSAFILCLYFFIMYFVFLNPIPASTYFLFLHFYYLKNINIIIGNFLVYYFETRWGVKKKKIHIYMHICSLNFPLPQEFLGILSQMKS